MLPPSGEFSFCRRLREASTDSVNHARQCQCDFPVFVYHQPPEGHMKTSSSRSHLRTIALLVCCSILSGLILSSFGCKPVGAIKNEVSGKVTYKGAPVTGGTLTFIGQNNYMLPCEIASDATYHATNAAIGPCKVTIETESVKIVDPDELDKAKKTMSKAEYDKYAAAMQESMKNPPGGRIYVKIPKKYADAKTTTLAYDVAEGKQVKDFDLSD
jgi:hypothetical protein